MNTLKICISCIISRFYQCFESCLHQCAYTAAKNCLLTEQIRFCFRTECSFQHPCPGTADSQRIGKSHIKGFACSILMNRHETGNPFSCLIFAPYSMARPFGCNHGHIYILRRNDLSKVNIKSMGKHKHISRFQVGFNGLLIHLCLQFVINQNHNDICLLSRFCRSIYLKSLRLRLCPGFRAFIKPDNYIAP